MKKYLFLSAEDRRPVEESGYRYKKSKTVTAVKTKRDEDGFFIPWAMFRPLGEKGLFCELFGASSVRRAADLRMNRDLLLKEAYMGSSGAEAVDRKQKIRDRYKGVDASELEVIPAKAVEGLGESTSIRRVAAYVRVSTDTHGLLL